MSRTNHGAAGPPVDGATDVQCMRASLLSLFMGSLHAVRSLPQPSSLP